MFTFIHTGDLQLGKPFGSFPSELAGQLKSARIDIVERIATLAREKGARHILVAGDVWDNEQPSEATLTQPLDIMGQDSAIIWWLLPGNHDPHRSGGLWTRIAKRAPDNVRLLLDAKPVEMEAGVYVLPCPWRSKNPGRDITAEMNTMQTPEGALRIGLCHGSVTDFQRGTTQSNAIDKNRTAAANLDYLALGDWHGTLQIDARTWYSGTPEADQFPDNIKGQTLCVTLDSKTTLPVVEAIRTTRFEWIKQRVTLTPDTLMNDVLSILPTGDHPIRYTLVKLYLEGSITYTQQSDLDKILTAATARFANLTIRKRDLSLRLDQVDLDSFDGSGSVAEVAQKLVEIGRDDKESSETRAVAQRALEELFHLHQHAKGSETQ